MGARFPTGFTFHELTYPQYEEQLLNPDEDASSLDEARAERAQDYSPDLPDAPLRRSAPQKESDSVRRRSRDAARVPPSTSDARRERDKAA